MMLQVIVQEAIDKVCPNHGISFGKLDDKKTWRIDFKSEATDEQKTNAKKILEDFIWDDAAKEKSRLKSKIEEYKDNLLFRFLFNEYKQKSPDATIQDFIHYLEKLEI